MKKLPLIIILFSAVFFCILSCSAQMYEKGVIKYKAELISTSPSATCPFRGDDATIIFKPGKFREDDDVSSGYMKRITIYVGDNRFSLVDGPAKKIKVIYTKPHNGVYTGMLAEDSTYTVKYTNDTMTINGYLCKSVVIQDNKGKKFIAYVTEAIAVNNNLFNDFPYKKVKGFPLLFEIEEMGSKVLFKTSFIDLKTPINDIDFILNDTGYEVVMGGE